MVTNGRYNLARLHARKIARLPEPPDSFEFRETDLSDSMLKLFASNDLIETATDGSPRHRHDWQVVPDIYTHAVDHLSNRETFSCCGSTGVTNDGGDLRCIDCGELVSEEEYRSVLG